VTINIFGSLSHIALFVKKSLGPGLELLIKTGYGQPLNHFNNGEYVDPLSNIMYVSSPNLLSCLIVFLM
jgi:hypothetical protein